MLNYACIASGAVAIQMGAFWLSLSVEDFRLASYRHAVSASLAGLFHLGIGSSLVILTAIGKAAL